MRKLVGMLLASLLASVAWADTWTDPDTGYTWTYKISGDTAEITGSYSYNSNSYTIPCISPLPVGNVVIPEALGGKSVTTIGLSSFIRCKGLTSITIPDSVKTIGNGAFYECSGLASVTIGNGVTSIEGAAFYGCSALTRVVLPDNVTSISSIAFAKCSSLTSIYIPANMTNILWGSFAPITPDYNGLTNISVSVDNQKYKSVNGLLLTIDGTALLKGINGEVVIPDGVTSIEFGAFAGCGSLKSVTIPNSVVSISAQAFDTCISLTNIVIPASVTNIEQNVFAGCDRLLSIEVEDGNPSYQSAGGILLTKDGTRLVTVPGGMTSVSIPDGVESVGDYAFKDYGHLTSVTMPESVRSIGYCAFYGCNSLTNVTIPVGMVSIGDLAFEGCNYLLYDRTTISGVKLIDGWAVGYVKGLRDLDLAGVRGVGARAFYDCDSLTNVTISGSVKHVGPSAFYGCDALINVVIENGVESFGYCAFSECNALTSVVLPASVTNIGSAAAFTRCGGLMSYEVANDNPSYKSVSGLLLTKDGKTLVCGINGDVIIPDGVSQIDPSAFAGCVALTSVTIPNSVTSIGSREFANCSSLTNVVIHDGVTSIGDYAFSGCSGLTSVTIPDSVLEILESAFSSCSSLTNVVIGNGVLILEPRVFLDCNDALYDTTTIPGIKLVDGWAIGAMRTPSGNLDLAGIRGIGDGAFRSCIGLTSVTIPEGVMSIGWDAFSGCKNLASVTIPDSVMCVGAGAFSGCNEALYDTTTISGVKLVDGWVVGTTETLSHNPDLLGIRGIGDGAFHNCISLTSVTIPDGVTSIGWDAFSGCSSLTSVRIPDSVTSILGFAFLGCSGLTSVWIPGSVTNIDNRAFSGCSGLSRVIFEGNAPLCHNSFSGVSSNCVAYVARNSAGWGVDIPGEWNGIRIEYIYCEKEEYTIVFNSFVDGVEIASRKRLYGETLGELPVIDADRYGFTFGGWENVDEGTIVTSNMMISAIWNRNVYAVSFDAHAEDEEIGNMEKFYEESFGGLPQPTWSGHVFIGWYTDELGGEEIKATDKVMSDITLHAHWAEGPFACEYGGALWSYQSYNGVATIISATTSEDSLTIPEMLGGAEVVEIPAACFAQTASLKCLSIPNSVTNIAEYAFYSCTNLEEVVFSDGLMKIGSGAFAECTNLKDVILPSTLIALGDKYAPSKACWGDEDACTRLTSYAKDFLSEGTNFLATAVGLEEFHDSDYEFEEINEGDAYTETETHATNEAFTAWGTICGESEGCELSCDWKTTSSHGYHFSRVGETNTMSRSDICNSSRNARVEGVHCAMGVFEGCEALESVSLNYGLRQIGAGTFKNCTSLKSLRIPDTVISIGGHAESVEGCFEGSVSTVSDLLEMNDYKPRLLTSDQAIDNVSRHGTYKGSGFLQGCLGLTNVMLSANLGYLGPYSFAGCANLVSIGLPDSLRTLNEGTFSGCAKLETVALPKALDLVGGYEFTSKSEYFCRKDTLTNNGSRPSTLMLEEEITTQYDADGGVLAVDTLISNGGTPSAITIYSKTNIVDNADGTFTVEGLLVQNEMVTNLVTYVVEYDDIDLDNRWQDGVGTIFVPKTIIGIDIDVAGRDCLAELMDFVSARYSGAAGKSLAARNRFSPAAPTYNGKTFSPDSGVFSGCVSLKSITLPDTVRRIADYAFYDCAELASVNVPDSLEVVGYDAFGGMTSLPDFNAPWQGNTSTIDDMLSNGRTFDEIASLFAGVSTFATDANESLSQEDRVHIACSFANSVIYALNRFGSADRFSTFHGIGDVLNSLSDVLRVTGTSLTASVQQEIATGVFRAATNALVSLTAVEHDLSTIKSFNGVGDTLTGLANVFDATGAGLAVYQQQLFAEGAFAATTNVLVSIKSAERDFSNLESFAGVGDILTGLADVLCALGANSSEEEQTRFVCIVTECATSMISALMDGTVLVPSLESYNGIGDVFMGLHDLYSSLYPKLSAGRKVMLSDMIYDSMTLAKDVIMVSDKLIDDELSKLLSGAGECLKFIDGAADDPIPILLSGTTNNEIIDLVKDIAFVDATLYDVISADVNEYSAFREWALKVKGVGANASAPAGANAVVNAPHAAAAFLLGATKLFENEPIIKMCDVSIESSPGCGGVHGTMIVGVAVKDGERTVAVDAAKIAAMFEATSDLGDWGGAALPVTIEPLGCENAAMQFRVAPSSYTAPQVFLRIRQ